MPEPQLWSLLLSLLVEQQSAIDAEVQRRSDELRRALLHNISHELRTPLASIVASASSLRQSDVDWSAGEQVEFAQAIEDEALRLNRVVDNLLDLARIEGGTLQPVKGWYDIGALIDDVAGRLRPHLEQQHLHVHVEEDLPPVELDYVAIDRVLTNLIEHAASRTPAGGIIVIRACAGDSAIRLSIADAGPPVDASGLPRLFEAFTRPKGFGLGLAVAKGVVEAHGGQMWADNSAHGGLQMSFTLPV